MRSVSWACGPEAGTEAAARSGVGGGGGSDNCAGGAAAFGGSADHIPTSVIDGSIILDVSDGLSAEQFASSPEDIQGLESIL